MEENIYDDDESNEDSDWDSDWDNRWQVEDSPFAEEEDCDHCGPECEYWGGEGI